jgi:hypothetical protein
VALEVAHMEAVLSLNDRDFQRGMGRSESSFQRFSRTATRVALGVAAALVAGGAVGIRAARDQGEAVNKATVTFGRSAPVILEWSKTTARAMGISRTASLQAAGGFGALFQEAGQAPPVAAKFSQSMVKAAADLGSFHDVDPTEVLESLRSGLAGETEPLRRFNIFMSEATLKAFAYKHGIAETGSELTENQKILARQGFILSHVGKASGDFARTADEGANAQRRASAMAEDASAKFGGMLLPAYTKLLSIGIKLLDWTQKHQTETKILIGAAAGLAAGILLLTTAVKVYSFATSAATKATVKLMLAMLTNPIFLVIAALVALGVGLVVLWKKSERFRSIVTAVFNFVRDAALELADKFLWMMSKILQGFEFMARQASKIPIIGDKFKGLADDIAGAREKVEGLRKGIDNLKSKRVDIRVVLHGWDAIEAVRGIGRGDVELPVGPRRDVVSIGRWLQSLGFHVAEHPQFGGVSPGSHTAGSFHYSGRAIDVNWPVPSQEPAMLDRIMPLLRALNPLELLWRTAGHFDHLHLALARGGIFTKPWTGMVSVAERGKPEGFIPLPASGPALSGRPQELHVHFTNHGVLGSENEVVRWLRNATTRWARMNGGEPPF